MTINERREILNQQIAQAKSQLADGVKMKEEAEKLLFGLYSALETINALEQDFASQKA
jgi:hypothetical protein